MHAPRILFIFTLVHLAVTQDDDQSLGLLVGTQSLTPNPNPSAGVTINNVNNDTSCTTSKGEVGECVPFYLCNRNSSLSTDRVDIIDSHGGNVQCSSYWDTCCPLLDRRAPNNPILPNKEPQPHREGCGYRNPDGVLGHHKLRPQLNEETQFGEFPWVVAILKTDPENKNDPSGNNLYVYGGSGSLIHLSVVLTAAHLVPTAGQLRVRAGEWDTQTIKEIYPHQERDVTKFYVHKDFNKRSLYYDIAVLFLSAPMTPAPNVGVVCLPPPGLSPEGGARCLATGWGKDRFEKQNHYQVLLKKIEVPVVEHSKCRDALRRTRLGSIFELHSSFLCAGGERDIDTCRGDGGAPLVCPIEFEADRFMQSGIVAWGIGCDGTTPGVFVNVARLRDWIDDKVKGQGYEISDYSYTV